MSGDKKRYNLTLDEELIEAVDRRHDNRSAFVQKAVGNELRREKAEELEHEHIEGYRDDSPDRQEFTPLFEEQEWPS